MVRYLNSLRRRAIQRFGTGAALGGVFALLAASVAVASIPDSSGAIHGCYVKATGSLRVIDPATDSCRQSETALLWNQTGPQGPAGPPGPAGQSAGAVAYSLATLVCGSGHDGGVTDPSLRTGFGFITGTFNSPTGATCVGADFQMFQTFVFQNVGGPGNAIAVGTGSATCDPCTVSGLTGAVHFALTVLGPATLDPDTGLPNGVQSLGGTWTISAATGALTGLTGQGIYDSSTELFTGTVKVPT
jgi:hypothetical protein